MSGSRDPIRVYLEGERRRQRRRQLGWIVAAVIVSIILWAMLATVLAVYG